MAQGGNNYEMLTEEPKIPVTETMANHTGSDKIQLLLDKNTSLKKVNSVLIFVVIIYGILLLILGIVAFVVMGELKGEDKDASRAFQGRTGPQEPLVVNITGPQGPEGIPGSQGPPGPQGNSTGTSGAIYVRWGRTTCPPVSEMTYAGIAGGKHYSHSGSGSNYLCLPEDPEYDVYHEGVDHWRGAVYSAEYEIFDLPPYVGKHNREVPCAVCRTTNRGSVLMIPAKMTCPSGWTKEYHGYLMSEYFDRESGYEFVCVDRNSEVVPGGLTNENGALFYPVEGRCDGTRNTGNLPCTPYINGAELTCVVCSK